MKKMVISRAPVRICDIGGWTDTWFYPNGAVFNICVDLYSYVRIVESNNDKVRIFAENLKEYAEIKNHSEIEYNGNLDLLKAAIKRIKILGGMDVFIRAEAPPACGTGTSASVAVALVSALARWQEIEMNPLEVAKLAHLLEIEELKLESGVQDQYAAASGGINFMEVNYPDVKLHKIQVSKKRILELENQLILVYLSSRSSSKMHQAVIRNFKNKRIVDLSGNIYFGNGIFKAGSPESKKISLIGRKKEIAELRKHIELYKRKKEELSNSESEINKEIIKGRAGLEEILKKFEFIAGELKNLEKDISILEFDLEKDKEKFKNLNGELNQIELFKTDIKSVDELENEVEKLDARRIRLEKSLEELKNIEKNLEAERKEKENNRMNKKLIVTRKEEELIRFEKEKQRYEEDLKEAKSTIEKVESNFEKTKNDISQVNKNIVRLDRKISQLFKEKEIKEEERKEVSNLTEELREIVNNLEDDIKTLRNKKDELNNKLYNEKLEISKIEEKINSLQKLLREEGFISDKKISIQDVDIEKEKEDLAKLETKVQNFGPINLLAIDDYNVEKERLDFLIQQRKDLIDAEKSLLKTVEKINITAKERFRNTFERIRRNYMEIFTKFFEDGEADLKLITTDDPLEYKIEVISRPFGKKITSTNLLSGGEKALTAIILLFSIYREKPSPFCILDEVDAPLDDENILRFLKVLKEFSRDTQFIIVTHNKKTMEASNFLYGVTMEENGVSKVVSVDINSN